MRSLFCVTWHCINNRLLIYIFALNNIPDLTYKRFLLYYKVCLVFPIDLSVSQQQPAANLKNTVIQLFEY